MIGLLLALCIGALGIAPYQPNPSHGMGFGFSSPATAPRLNPVGDKNPGPLQQFAAGKHILGFAPGYVVVASGSHALKVEFVDANPVNPHSDQPGGGGKDHPAPELTEVRYPGLWQGIDLAYRADPNGIAETVWKVEPGADIRQARLRYNRPLTLNPDGSLNIIYPTGSLTESAPIAWQIKDGQRQPVAVAFALNGGQELGFTLGNHDPDLPVWIDPTLSWNTFLGGPGGNGGNAIAVDGSGNVYVTGSSDVTWGSPLRAFSGDGDAFVAKLDSNGNLLWSTFLGGANFDYGSAIAVDGSGTVYVVGISFYTTWGNPLRAFSGNFDAFVAKLDSNGNLLWNTFMGGTDGDGIAVDGSGNVYVTGFSFANWGNPQRAFGGGAAAYVTKLDNTGQLMWNTFLDGAGGDFGSAIAVDGSGNVYVAGDSSASWGSPQRAFSGGTDDAFVAKLDKTGQLVWNTFLSGGAPYGYGYGIAVDGSGNVYVTGYSSATWGNPLRAFSDNLDAFVAKLDSTGKLVWNTFLGGTDDDVGGGIAVDGGGNVYVTGKSYASWGSPLWAFGGGTDAFVAQLDNTGQLLWNTFLRGEYYNDGRGITMDGSGNVYVTGMSYASWGNPQRAFGGGIDAFVVKLGKDVNRVGECVMNWAEANYPSLLAPMGSLSTSAGGYLFRYYAASRSYLGVSSANNHLVYQGADGVLQDGGPLKDWLPKSSCETAANLPSSDCLFNWAEANYPGQFAPAGSPTEVSAAFTSRNYAATKAKLGVSATNNHLYYQGADGSLLDEGPLSKWLPLAGCQ